MIHIAAVTQLRHDPTGQAYYRRKRSENKKPMEAMRCLKRRISDAIYRQLVADAQLAAGTDLGTGPGGHWGRLKNPARSTCPRTSTLRISHFPDPRNRRYNRRGPSGRTSPGRPRRRQVDNRGEPKRATSPLTPWPAAVRRPGTLSD